MNCKSETGLRGLLLQDERFVQFTVQKDGVGREWVGLHEQLATRCTGCTDTPGRDTSFVPTGEDIIEDGDRLTIIGNPYRCV